MQSKGTVKMFNSEKGWGFIKRDEGGPDCFVHWRQIRSDGYKFLEPGERVAFDIETTDRGLMAVNVTVVFEE